MTNQDEIKKTPYSDAWIKYSNQEKIRYDRPVEAEAVRLIQALNLPKINKIFDIGCGSAGLLERLLIDNISFQHYIGLDRTLAILKAAQSIKSPKSQFVEWDLENPTPLKFTKNENSIFSLIRILNNLTDRACETLLRHLKHHHNLCGFVIINPADNVDDNAVSTINAQSEINLISTTAIEEFEGSSTIHYLRSPAQYKAALSRLGYTSVKTREFSLKGSSQVTHSALFGII